MSLRNSALLFLVFILIGCNPKEKSDNYLIELDEFETLSKLKSTKIIDFRKPNEYQQGHIKNAINVWRTDIEDSSFPYGGMKASKEQLEMLFSNLGINSEDTLVIYDDKGLCEAARLWWVLQYYNFKNVKLLNGGLTTLQNAAKSLTRETTSFSKSKFKFTGENNHRYFADKDQIIEAVKNNSRILDTRTEDEFIGKQLKKGAYRAGRIPNSKRIDWANAINYNGDKKIKSIAELKNVYAGLLDNREDTLYVYCHSGVRSAHTTFVLTQLLNYKHVLNYDGSWTEWSYHENLPLKKDN